MKKSITNKIKYLLAFSLITLAFFIISVNFIIIFQTTGYNSKIMMSKTCYSQALELNGLFHLVEQSVQNLYDISEEFRPSAAELKNEAVAKAYVDQFLDIAITIADNTDGALAVYYRMNPDLSLNGKTGFFCVRSPESGKFEQTEATDLLAYDVNDVEHVGWYYVPVWAGKPVWMEPYYNANIDVDMISYVAPIYDGNDLVGVVGIDVDFNAIKAIAENIDIYKSCGAVLCSLGNSAVYYNKCNLFGNTIPSEIYRILQSHEESENIIIDEIDGVKYGLYFKTLQNHMKLVLYAKASEIYSEWRVSILNSIIISVLVFVITFLLAIKMGKRIVKPISDITEATKSFAQGNWDVKLHCDTEDELQLLTENISVMADKTKEYIAYIHNMAQKDGLTGLRNKMAYLQYVDKIQFEYIPAGKEFAVVVFDVNNLKTVNDNYGHEKGDALIVSASKFICKYFAHSPVFRIGGDEFVAIVDGGDFEARDAIIQEFCKYMSLAKNSSDIMEVCIACGMAAFGLDAATFEEVFKLADQRMYINKKELKNGALPR